MSVLNSDHELVIFLDLANLAIETQVAALLDALDHSRLELTDFFFDSLFLFVKSFGLHGGLLIG